MKKAFFEAVEDEYDIVLAEQSYYEYLKDPVTISHEELLKELKKMSYKISYTRQSVKQIKKWIITLVLCC